MQKTFALTCAFLCLLAVLLPLLCACAQTSTHNAKSTLACTYLPQTPNSPKDCHSPLHYTINKDHFTKTLSKVNYQPCNKDEIRETPRLQLTQKYSTNNRTDKAYLSYHSNPLINYVHARSAIRHRANSNTHKLPNWTSLD